MRTLFMIATIATAAAASPVVAQTDSTAARFPHPETISGDPTGMRPLPGKDAAPRYPDAERAKSAVATPVVAFVVDTSGRVELPSASFLNDTPSDFEHAVCDILPALRFTPLAIGGVKQ